MSEPQGPTTSQPQHLLELTDVAKHFGGLYALSGLTFHVDEGEIVSVIGPNGAGKSTMFNVVTGLYEPDDGSIRFRGENVVGLAANQVTKLGIARTFQTVHLFPNMTILENAMVGQHCRTKSGVLGSVLRLPVDPPRRGTDPSAGEGEPSVLRLASRRLPGGAARVRALVREPATTRDGQGAGHRSVAGHAR